MAWKNIDDSFTIDDIGARLLSNLAKGIYNHEAVLREYVQNARDAYADLAKMPENPAIQIRVVDSTTISVQDNGVGMDLRDVKSAKRIAVSPKAGKNGRVGFRGIGIWAGFQACDTLDVETTKAGDPHRYRLRINFAEILKHVDEDINIKVLLDKRFSIQEAAAEKDEHYTIIKLIGLHGDYAKLGSPDELRRIASQILPCRIDSKFEHEGAVRKFLDGFEEYQEFPVFVDGAEVYRQFPTGLSDPRTRVLQRDGMEFARVWWCTGRASIKAKGFQYRNFRLRVWNFAVGREGIYDDENGSSFGVVRMPKLGSVAHLNWHVGEIHVTNPDLRPDTPRSNLELDSTSRMAIDEIRAFYDECITDSRARSVFNPVYEEMMAFDEKTATLEAAAELLSKLQKHEKIVAERKHTDKVNKRLREFLTPKGVKEARKKLIEKLSKLVDAKPSQSDKGSDTRKGGGKQSNGEGKAQSGTAGADTAGESGGSATASGGTSNPGIDGDQVLSDVFAAVKGKIGSDEDLFAEVCQEIETVFKQHGLIDA